MLVNGKIYLGDQILIRIFVNDQVAELVDARGKDPRFENTKK